MILEVGKLGIKRISNVHTQIDMEMILVCKGMHSRITLNNVRYISIDNEVLEMKDGESARAMLLILNTVLVVGEDAEMLLANMTDVLHTFLY